MESLLNQVFSEVFAEDERVVFKRADGTGFQLAHSQDCCESVWVGEISGDLNDLVGTPIISAEESYENNPNASESGTYSFYRLATIKGYVQIRFNGESNGYYSETAALYTYPQDSWLY